jgi:hypothetical protein
MNDKELPIKQQIIEAFYKEFGFIKEKFEIMELAMSNEKIDYDALNDIKLPSIENNIVWHPGVYVFSGNNEVYRIGVSLKNSRSRVMEHWINGTSKDGFCVCDIDNFDDRSILLINVKKADEKYWLLALEAYLELKFKPKIWASRIG